MRQIARWTVIAFAAVGCSSHSDPDAPGDAVDAGFDASAQGGATGVGTSSGVGGGAPGSGGAAGRGGGGSSTGGRAGNSGSSGSSTGGIGGTAGNGADSSTTGTSGAAGKDASSDGDAGAGGTGGRDASTGTGGSAGGPVGADCSCSDYVGESCVPIAPDGGLAPVCSQPSVWIPAPPRCGAALCGNNTPEDCVDSCGKPTYEVCDGTQLRGTTCQDLGYAGGQLKCTRWCDLDPTDCTRCAATDAAVPSCINAPLDARGVTSMVVDATDQEIGVAWLSLGATGDLGLHFARLAPDLTLIRQVGPIGPTCPSRVTLAARVGGWSIAVEAGGLHLLALDATGTLTSDVAFPTRLDHRPTLVPRAGAAPLLLSVPPDSMAPRSHISAALVNAAGNALGAESIIAAPGEVLYPGSETGVAVSDGWLIALTSMVNNSTTAYVMHLAPDGTPGAAFTAPFGPEVEFPRLAAAGTEIRMSVSSFGATADPSYVPLTIAGATAGPAVPAGGFPNIGGPAAIAVQSTNTLLARPSLIAGQPGRLDLLTLDAAGSVAYPMRAIATGPDWFVAHQMVRRGPDVVLAWINGDVEGSFPRIGPTGIGIARMTP